MGKKRQKEELPELAGNAGVQRERSGLVQEYLEPIITAIIIALFIPAPLSSRLSRFPRAPWRPTLLVGDAHPCHKIHLRALGSHSQTLNLFQFQESQERGIRLSLFTQGHNPRITSKRVPSGQREKRSKSSGTGSTSMIS